MIRDRHTLGLGLLLLGVAIAAPSSAQVRAPYVQQTSPDAATIVWQAEVREPGVVCYGTSPDALDVSVRSDGELTTHVLSPTGLTAGTRYFYSAGATCRSVAHPADYFVTSPAVGSTEPFRAWIVGDSGTGGSAQAAVRDAMLEYTVDQRPDLFLHMGDMAYSSGTTTEFTARFFDVYAEVLRNTPCWPTMGNHEGYTSDSASQAGPYYDAYVLPTRGEAGGLPSGTEAYYSFDYANAHFVVLESYETNRDPDGAMLTWLREDLAATDQEWIVAYWHHPPYTKGSHDSDTEGRLINMREDSLPILEAAGVDLVLGGHSHIYERSYLLSGGYETPSTAAGILDGGNGRSDGDGAYQTSGAGTVYIVSGHGGAGLSQEDEHPVMYFADTQNGSNLLDIDGSTLTVTNLLANGSVNDSVTIDKSDGLNILHPRTGGAVLVDSDSQVRWTSRSAGRTVHVDYSVDDRSTWYRAGDAVPNNGRFEWSVPAWPTDVAWLRIREVGGDAEDIVGPFRLNSRSESEVISYGGVWEYSDWDAAPGSGWQTSSGEWPTGPGQLGYGDGDEATVLRDESPNIPSAYFRTRIGIDGEPISASVRVLFDDGYVLWVNGTEVARENIVSIAHEDYGTASSSDDEVEVTAFTGALIEGTNDIAVMVKQRSTGSSDLSFDLALTVAVEAVIDPRPPTDPPVDSATPDPDPIDDVGPDPDVGDAGVDPGHDSGSDAPDGAETDTPLADDVEPDADMSPGIDTDVDADATEVDVAPDMSAEGDSAIDTGPTEDVPQAEGPSADTPLSDTGSALPQTENIVVRGSGCQSSRSPTESPLLVFATIALCRLRRRAFHHSTAAQ